MTLRRPVDAVMAFGIVVSVGLGVALSVLTSLKVLEAVAVSMGGIMITLLVDIIARVERRHSEEDEQARLAAMIRRVDGMFAKFEVLARAMATIEHGSHGPAFKREAARHLDELARKLEELERQEMRVPVDDTELLFEQFERTTKTLHAVSIDALDSAWRWSNETGARYWSAHEAALEKGLQIERVFVYKILTSEFLDNVERQLDKG